jgi:hypothetical protein
MAGTTGVTVPHRVTRALPPGIPRPSMALRLPTMHNTAKIRIKYKNGIILHPKYGKYIIEYQSQRTAAEPSMA